MTVEFGKDSKLNFTQLEKDDAPYYVCFLEVEVDRHQKAIKDAKYEQIYYKNDHLMWKLWASAIHRHDLDIRSTNNRILEVKHWFSIDD